jgi:hypothetical protein
VALSTDTAKNGSTGNGVTMGDAKLIAHAADEFLSGRVTFGADGAPVFRDEFVEFAAADASHFCCLVGIDCRGREFAIADLLHQGDCRIFAIGKEFNGGGAQVFGE